MCFYYQFVFHTSQPARLLFSDAETREHRGQYVFCRNFTGDGAQRVNGVL
jgi:hypothetical protein